jgi:hypothetical protein
MRHFRGYGWVDGMNASEYFVWSAFASGTELIVKGPTAGTLVPLQLVLPRSDLSLDNGRPSSLPNPPDPLDPPPVQGLFIDGVGPGAPSFFDVFVEFDASVQQGSTDQALFNGSATLQSSNGALTTTGNFDNAFSHETGDFLASATISSDVLGPVFMVEAGVPFHLTMDLFMSMGDPNRLGTSAATVPGFPGIPGITQSQTLGGGGSIVTELRLLGGGTLSVIPEPTSTVVWLIGMIASASFFRRRKASGR